VAFALTYFTMLDTPDISTSSQGALDYWADSVNRSQVIVAATLCGVSVLLFIGLAVGLAELLHPGALTKQHTAFGSQAPSLRRLFWSRQGALPSSAVRVIAELPRPVSRSPTTSVRINWLAEPTVLGAEVDAVCAVAIACYSTSDCAASLLVPGSSQADGLQGRSTLENRPSPWKIIRCEGAR
jgi:hypothetical protein